MLPDTKRELFTTDNEKSICPSVVRLIRVFICSEAYMRCLCSFLQWINSPDHYFSMPAILSNSLTCHSFMHPCTYLFQSLFSLVQPKQIRFYWRRKKLQETQKSVQKTAANNTEIYYARYRARDMCDRDFSTIIIIAVSRQKCFLAFSSSLLPTHRRASL